MNEKDNKDYFLPVMLSQILICITVVFLIFLNSKNTDGLKNDFFRLIENNIEGTELVSAMKKIITSFSADEGEILYYENSDEEFSKLNGIGGPELDLFEAAENASFAPVFSTVKICSPIEDGRYTSHFGYRTNPISGDFAFHTGTDIAAPEGTRIRAAFNGVVTNTGFDKQAGNYIYLTHNDGLVTFYCHCSEILVDTDTVIRQGEAIALVGATGSATGPHVHFEVRKCGIRYNPMWLL